MPCPYGLCCNFCPFRISSTCLMTYIGIDILNFSPIYQNYINTRNSYISEEFMPLRSNKVIPIKIVIEKGSVWDSPKGKNLINEEIDEARRIWFANAGVKVHFLKDFVMAKGDLNKPLSKDNVKNYAKAHYTEKNVIVIVFRNESVVEEDSRAYTEPSLVNENTPVIIIGSKVFNKPGTIRDLAHELGHVFLRSAGHSFGMNDLMSLGPDIGDQLTKAQIEKANKYPD